MSWEIEMDDFDILSVSVKLKNGTVQKFDVKKELEIDKYSLNDEFVEQPGKYMWWAAMAETAKYQKEVAEARLDRAEAEADYQARLKLELDGQKVTETLVKHQIKLDDNYKKALEEYQQAEKVARMFDKIVKAFDQRLDALISLGANLRNEGENVEVTMLKEKAKQITKRQ